MRLTQNPKTQRITPTNVSRQRRHRGHRRPTRSSRRTTNTKKRTINSRDRNSVNTINHHHHRQRRSNKSRRFPGSSSSIQRTPTRRLTTHRVNNSHRHRHRHQSSHGLGRSTFSNLRNHASKSSHTTIHTSGSTGQKEVYQTNLSK